MRPLNPIGLQWPSGYHPRHNPPEEVGPGSILAGGRFGAMPIRRTSSRGLRLPGEIPGGHPTLVGLLFVVVVGGGAQQMLSHGAHLGPDFQVQL